ncbi:hypothetical protein DRE_01409 [Drechslerella stenobrocha 248]|uniref:BZIP domain-containing protein n=1 Tax=Drechslerella stenobrocha 248 TaxID=1043628 RepID=W7HVI7_9PEZI|nr:hypothetical protein DRE_01409 [Drechslerella stenobrocha 248]
MAAAVKESPVSPSSSMSSPEGTAIPDAAAAQKRKGGRKPVYATQEERKMRNRAAQAAFRERRTEYIKHLEATIKQQEEALASLQQSSRSAADEVLMLRAHAGLGVGSAGAGSSSSSNFKKMRRLSESSFFQKPSSMMHSPTGKVTSPSVSVEMASPVTSEPSPAGGSAHTFLARPSPGAAPRRFSHAPDLASLATLYPQQYQAHMDKLEQEYDAEMYDENEGEDEDGDGHDVLVPLSSADFPMGSRGAPPLTTGAGGHHLPALASPLGQVTTAGGAKLPNMATTNDSMLQQYYSTGSWTVDLFSDPYMMGPLQFPNPFTNFPTSSMR